ncbi:MAG: MTH1187 family thiamine-binding protein [Methanomassiliicoccales archaeon]
MLAEFSVTPIGAGESVSEYVAECVRILESRGLKYQLTPMATVVEGETSEVMDAIMECHRKVMGMSNRVITSIKIDDRKGREDAITSKTESVMKRLDR